MPFPRNRVQTQARILAAARELLAEQGFLGWGLNALAARAQADKVLIYRYFEDLDGVERALAREAARWLPELEGSLLESAHSLATRLSEDRTTTTLLRWVPVGAKNSPLMERAQRERQLWERACANQLGGSLRPQRAQWIFAAVLAEPERSGLWRPTVEALIQLGETPSRPEEQSWAHAQLPTELL